LTYTYRDDQDKYNIHYYVQNYTRRGLISLGFWISGILERGFFFFMWKDENEILYSSDNYPSSTMYSDRPVDDGHLKNKKKNYGHVHRMQWVIRRDLEPSSPRFRFLFYEFSDNL